MKLKLLFPALLICAPRAAAQTFLTIAAESFDYPAGADLGGQNGGSGWSNAWDGGNGTVISTPGLDGVGNKATTSVNWAVSGRNLATTGFEYLLDGGQFGADGTTIWISLRAVRSTAANGGWGGVSLYDSGGTERLFFGSPWLSSLWGIHERPTDIQHLVAGSNVDVPTELVMRIDFMAGLERVRLWLDPTVPHPDTVADIDIPYPDLRFTRARIGSGGNNGTELYDFDAVRLETPSLTIGTSLCFGDGSAAPCGCGNEATPGSGGGCANGAPMPAGQGAVLSAAGTNSVAADDLVLTADFTTNQPGLFFQGNNAIGGGTGVTFGDGIRCCGGSVVRLEIADPPGTAGPKTTSTTRPILGTSPPGTTTPGDTRCYQWWYRNPGTSSCGSNFNLSSAVLLTWAP